MVQLIIYILDRKYQYIFKMIWREISSIVFSQRNILNVYSLHRKQLSCQNCKMILTMKIIFLHSSNIIKWLFCEIIWLLWKNKKQLIFLNGCKCKTHFFERSKLTFSKEDIKNGYSNFEYVYFFYNIIIKSNSNSNFIIMNNCCKV